MPNCWSYLLNPEQPAPFKVKPLRRTKKVKEITQEWRYKGPIMPLYEYGTKQSKENTLEIQSKKMPQMRHSADPMPTGSNTVVVSPMIHEPNTKGKVVVSSPGWGIYTNYQEADNGRIWFISDLNYYYGNTHQKYIPIDPLFGQRQNQ
ncbi:hypothetical protein FXO38_33971 [Capsicum annuum]|nr:hypothetical protein FXO38_33971 [Capsicum annuum]KAF3662322.1 hypothetical protein FXO37_12511 [Capsicum annuum]